MVTKLTTTVEICVGPDSARVCEGVVVSSWVVTAYSVGAGYQLVGGLLVDTLKNLLLETLSRMNSPRTWRQ